MPTVFNVALLSVSQNFLRDLFLHHKKTVSEAELEEYTSTMVSEGEWAYVGACPAVWEPALASLLPQQRLQMHDFMGRAWLWNSG